MIVFVTEYFFLEGRPNISRSFVSVRKRVLMYSTSSFKESVAEGRGFLACNVFISFYFAIVKTFYFFGLTWIVRSMNDHAFNSRSYKLTIAKFSTNDDLKIVHTVLKISEPKIHGYF